MYIYAPLCVHIHMCVCVCVCVREREKDQYFSSDSLSDSRTENDYSHQSKR